MLLLKAISFMFRQRAAVVLALSFFIGLNTSFIPVPQLSVPSGQAEHALVPDCEYFSVDFIVQDKEGIEVRHLRSKATELALLSVIEDLFFESKKRQAFIDKRVAPHLPHFLISFRYSQAPPVV